MNITLRRIRSLQAASLIACAVSMAGPALFVPTEPAQAQSQDQSPEARIRRMESEIRALQRQVFPGGDGKYFGPEISPTAKPSGAVTVGVPASTPVTDLLARMEALEAQLARLTAQTEVNSNKIAQLEARLPPVEAATPAPDGTPAPSATPTPSTTASNLNAMTGGASTPTATPSPIAKPAPAPTPKPVASVAPSAQRVAAVRAIEKPSTGNAGDDEYSYGFRLWEAKFYPEAQQQLKMMIEKYPRDPKISHARNLLGRAYLDDGKPRDAATWFLQNYQGDKNGARAPDSLLLLAESMRRLNDKNRACIALSEFGQTYSAEAAGRLKAQYDATRTPLKCS